MSLTEEKLRIPEFKAFSGVKTVVVPPSIFSENNAGTLLSPRRDERPFGGHILYTSGTTGAYKKILMCGEQEDRRNIARAEILSIHRNTVFHGFDFGLWTGVGFKTPPAIWSAGGAVIVDQRDQKFQYFFSHQITFAQFIPRMLQELTEARDPSASPLPNFTAAVGGGLVPLKTAEQCTQRLTRDLMIYYASTELISVPLQSRFGSAEDLNWFTPSHEGLVQVVDENNRECSIGQEGELRIALTDIDCHCYFDDEETTAKVFRDGFFYPGDLATRRSDGRVRILGRTSDVVIINAQKIAAGPIEQAIQQYLAVADVCLFAGPTKRGEEAVVLVIEFDKNIERSQIEAAVREFVPAKAVRFAIRKKFPRTGTGTRKINRRQLKRVVFDELEDMDT